MSKALKWGRKCTIATIAIAPYIIIRKFTYYYFRQVAKQAVLEAGRAQAQQHTPYFKVCILEEWQRIIWESVTAIFSLSEVNGNVLITLLFCSNTQIGCHCSVVEVQVETRCGQIVVNNKLPFIFAHTWKKNNLYIIFSRMFFY